MCREVLKGYKAPFIGHTSNNAFVSYECFIFGAQIFRVTLMLVYVYSKKMCLLSHSTYHLQVHGISKNMILKLPAQMLGGKKVMVS